MRVRARTGAARSRAKSEKVDRSAAYVPRATGQEASSPRVWQRNARSSLRLCDRRIKALVDLLRTYGGERRCVGNAAIEKRFRPDHRTDPTGHPRASGAEQAVYDAQLPMATLPARSKADGGFQLEKTDLVECTESPHCKQRGMEREKGTPRWLPFALAGCAKGGRAAQAGAACDRDYG